MKWAMLAVIASLLGGFYWYFQWSQSKMSLLTEHVAALDVALDQQSQTIDALQNFQEKQNANIIRLQQDLIESDTARQNLEIEFRSHDLEFLARERPVLIENIINRGTDQAFRDLEQLTGAAQDAPVEQPSSEDDSVIPPPLAD